MALGLAITGFVALGIYMLSVTDGPPARGRDGAQHHRLTQRRLHAVRQPAEMGGDPRPARAGVLPVSFRIEHMRPATAQMLFWLFAALVGLSLAVDLPGLHRTPRSPACSSSRRRRSVRSASTATRRSVTCRAWARSCSWACSASSSPRWSTSSWLELDAPVDHLGRRRAGVRRPHRLRHAADQEMYVYGAMDGEVPGRKAIMGALRSIWTSSTCSRCCCSCSATATSDVVNDIVIHTWLGPGIRRGLFLGRPVRRVAADRAQTDMRRGLRKVRGSPKLKVSRL